MQVVVECLEGEWRLRQDRRLRFVGHVQATKYLRGQVFSEWDEEWMEWITPTEDFNLGAGVTVTRVSKGPATTVAEGPLVEPDRELSPEESLVSRGVPVLDTFEVLVNRCS